MGLGDETKTTPPYLAARSLASVGAKALEGSASNLNPVKSIVSSSRKANTNEIHSRDDEKKKTEKKLKLGPG